MSETEYPMFDSNNAKNDISVSNDSETVNEAPPVALLGEIMDATTRELQDEKVEQRRKRVDDIENSFSETRALSDAALPSLPVLTMIPGNNCQSKFKIQNSKKSNLIFF